MKANELRIGLWVYLFGDAVQLTKDHLIYLLQKDGLPEPITITEEWLLNLGFKEVEIMWHDKSISDGVFLKGRHYIEFTTEGICFAEILDSAPNKKNHFIKVVKYVHEVQNLFFYLTGKELELSKPVDILSA